MNVTPVAQSGVAAKAASKTDAQSATLDYNSFLKLLLQQMKSQDPTHPVDQTQMLAQLASFSNVGQTIKINDKLDALIGSSQTQAAPSLIGQTVTSLVDGTTGVVKSIEITSSGSSAILTSGQKLELSQGIRVGT